MILAVLLHFSLFCLSSCFLSDQDSLHELLLGSDNGAAVAFSSLLPQPQMDKLEISLSSEESSTNEKEDHLTSAANVRRLMEFISTMNPSARGEFHMQANSGVDPIVRFLRGCLNGLAGENQKVVLLLPRVWGAALTFRVSCVVMPT